MANTFKMAVGCALVALTAAGAGTTHRVPDDFATLDAALTSPSVVDGDVIRITAAALTADRHTNDTLKLDLFATVDKGVTVMGAADPADCVIDCAGGGGIGVIHSNAVVCGVTLKNFANDVESSALWMQNGGIVSNVVINGTGSLTKKVNKVVNIGVKSLMTDSQVLNLDDFSWSRGDYLYLSGGGLRRTLVKGCRHVTYGVRSYKSGTVRSTIEDCEFASSWGWCTGMVYLENSDMRRSRIVGSQAYNQYGALQTVGATLTDCVISNSIPVDSTSRPVISVAGSSVSSFTNCLIVGNKTQSGAVVAISSSATGRFYNCTVAENKTTSGAVGGVTAPGRGFFVNCIVWNNITSTGAVDFDSAIDPARLAVSNSCYGGATPGVQGNVASDPLFRDVAGGDYALQDKSPCLDAGQEIPGLVTDIAGNARPRDGSGCGTAKTDIGCYEHDTCSIRLACNLVVTGTRGAAPCDVPLTAVISGIAQTGLSFEWLAIGSLKGVVTTNRATTSAANYTFEALPVGQYDFICTVKNDTDDEASDRKNGAFNVNPQTAYAALDGANVWPYDEPEIAATNLADAIDSAGSRVIVKPGHYTELTHTGGAGSGYEYTAVVGIPLEVVGEGGPARTIIDCGGKGGIQLNSTGAFVHGLAFTNYVNKSNAGHLFSVNGGVLSNVVACGGAKASTASRNLVSVAWQGAVDDLVMTGVVKSGSGAIQG